MYYIDLLVTGIINGCMYALMAMGLTMVYGLLRILHIAHAAIFTLGAFIGIVVANATGSLWLAFPAAILLSVLVGILIYRLIYQPLLKHPPFVALIASLGVLLIMEDGFRIAFGENGIPFRYNPYSLATKNIFGIVLNETQIALVLTTAVLLGLLYIFLERTRIGIAWRATEANPRMATSFGVNVLTVRYTNFAIGSAIAGIAGVLVALLNNFVEPSFGAVVSYKALAIIVLGGLGSTRGALIASLLLGVAESFGTVAVGDYLDRDAIAAIVLIVILMIRPQGLGVKGGA
ncbi:branched-chain amino acid ABC transporter permease [Bradyrhizobium prioriisuperbiae]|uniref:branched-chain amino acid ABC transporter permease n=1 Tax=Bradyrhizobium prioriisuperbiae TaxID=2854389 RepID=UPI0028F001C6|nr:branched-chain amino acid ABC transporter permease [Bradyrhizobium prioritasuperba]